MVDRIRVLLVNEIQLMCNVIAAALEDEPDIEVVGCATSLKEATEIVKHKDIDVALVSTRLPNQGALRLTNAIAETSPEVNVLVLGLTEKRERVIQFVEAGAAGYILKDDSVESMVESIRAARKGKAYVSPRIAAAMMERISELAQTFAEIEIGVTDSANLTEREMEVLELIGKNLTNQEIAERLVIEVGTVKNHVHSILEKLNVSSREQAAAYLAIIK